MNKIVQIFTVFALLGGFSSSAAALTINDVGVAGVMEGQVDAGPGNINEATIANEILGMGANQNKLVVIPIGVNCIGGQNNQSPCQYFTGANNYNGTVANGIQQTTNVTVLTPEALASEFILVKFDGPNAGYVLFNTAAWLGAGNTALPADGSGILNWGAEASGTSHYTYFGTRTVPDGGASVLLLGAALSGVGILRRRLNV